MIDSMFVNYFADDRRPIPLNLAFARVIIGVWLIWKTAMYDWHTLLAAPVMQTSEFAWAIPPIAPGLILEFERLLLIAVLIGFMVGYRIKLTAFSAALITAHLGTVRMTQITSGETESLFIGVYFLILFGLFADTDELSVDGIRRATNQPLPRLRERLATQDLDYPHPALRWWLLIVALIYFGSGFDKVFHQGITSPSLAFARPQNLPRWMQFFRPDGPVQFLAEFPVIMQLGALGALGLELGFLAAVLAGITVTPFMIGLIAFTALNVMLLGIHFVDVYFFVLVFAAWDGGVARLQSSETIDVVYDDTSRPTVLAAVVLAMCDANDTVQFTPGSTELAPEVSFAISTGDQSYSGIAAVCVVCRHFRFLVPIAWMFERSITRRASAALVRTYRLRRRNNLHQTEK